MNELVIKDIYKNEIVSFSVELDGTAVEVCESCDYYYKQKFNKTELTKIIEDLTKLRDGMGDDND
tara:strand:- start:217 stop:411 length:195 start_codon:yes stop_codon:yes gene_type:complete